MKKGLPATLENIFEELNGAENKIERINENIEHALRKEAERVGGLRAAQENKKVSINTKQLIESRKKN